MPNPILRPVHRLLLAMPLSLAACGASSGPTATPATKETAVPATPKTVVTTAMTELFGRRDLSALDRYWGEPYVQHNPTIPDGVEVLRQALASTEGWQTVRVLAEGDLVVTHSVARGWGPRPMVVFDIFLVRDGRMVEHWDVMQPVEEQTRSGRSQVDGPTEVTDLELTAANKAVVEQFFADVIYGHALDKLPVYINPRQYHQHNPGVGDGLEGFGAAMAELARAGLSMEYRKTYRTIAEGNFVFTHSEGTFAGRHVAFADLFRLEDGKIVEHWDTIQDVAPADGAANRNGMFAQRTR